VAQVGHLNGKGRRHESALDVTAIFKPTHYTLDYQASYSSLLNYRKPFEVLRSQLKVPGDETGNEDIGNQLKRIWQTQYTRSVYSPSNWSNRSLFGSEIS